MAEPLLHNSKGRNDPSLPISLFTILSYRKPITPLLYEGGERVRRHLYQFDKHIIQLEDDNPIIQQSR